MQNVFKLCYELCVILKVDIEQQRLFYNRLISAIHRITGCLAEETKVLKQSTRSTKRQSLRSTGNRSRSNSSSCPRRRAEAEWEEAWGAEGLTHQEVAGPASPRMRAGTRCPSPRTDPSTPPALARSPRYQVQVQEDILTTFLE